MGHVGLLGVITYFVQEGPDLVKLIILGVIAWFSLCVVVDVEVPKNLFETVTGHAVCNSWCP